MRKVIEDVRRPSPALGTPHAAGLHVKRLLGGVLTWTAGVLGCTSSHTAVTAPETGHTAPPGTSPSLAPQNHDPADAHSVRRIRYRWVAPVKLQNRIGPGMLDMTVDADGKVDGSFSPGGVAGPGRPGAGSPAFSFRIEPARAEQLWRLLDEAQFDTLDSVTVIQMGDGEPIEIGRDTEGVSVTKSFAQTKAPRELNPFLADVRTLAEELVEHPR